MIGIFDSGIGGVSIFKEILKTIPNYSYIYYSDSKHNPYGNLSKNELKKVTCKVIDYLISKGCLVIVIACNTASTLIDYFRDKYPDILFVGTVPAYKMVDDQKTLVLATKNTIESDSFLKLYKKHNNHNTTLYKCIGLANIIENDLNVDEYLLRFKKFKGVKNVVLGCTHYSLIKDNIVKVLGDVNFFDSCNGVSRQLEKTIKNLNLIQKPSIVFIDSSNNSTKEKRFYNILNN